MSTYHGSKQSQPQNPPDIWTCVGYRVITYNDFRLFNDSLGLVSAYIAQMDNFICGFAFAISGIEFAVASQAKPISKDLFETTARKMIMRELGSGQLADREEYTYEYNFTEQDFVRVNTPDWWIKTTLANGA